MSAPRPKRTRLRRAGHDQVPKLSREALNSLQEQIGYVFKDRSMIDRAMTHPSALPAGSNGKSSYQRLEFLGDRVLGLVIAERLFDRRPGEQEGRLAPRLNNLVNKRACARAARETGLGDFILLGESERKSGGSEKINILGDVCESVIGAIYMDGGLSPARKFIERAWSPQFGSDVKSIRDPKSRLQEWAQAQHLPLPDYRVVDRDGPDHAPDFRIAVHVGDAHTAEGNGTSKQDAERAAAEALLSRIETEDA
ncbi:MAG: ribonuclease III [Pseudomonadota bacterium]